MSEYLDTYATGLAEQGYTDHSIRRQIVAIADFSRWLKRKHVDVQALDNNVVIDFCGFVVGSSRLAEAIRKHWRE